MLGYFNHNHYLQLRWFSTLNDKNVSLTLSPRGTRISHSQSRLCWYVSGCAGDLNSVPGLVSSPPHPGTPSNGNIRIEILRYYNLMYQLHLSVQQIDFQFTLNLGPSKHESWDALIRSPRYGFICMEMDGCYMTWAGNWLRYTCFTIKTTVHC